MLLKVLTILCGFGVMALAGYIVFGDRFDGTAARATPSPIIIASQNAEPPGVTVLVKEPGTRRTAPSILTAPTGEGGVTGSVSAYAIELGGAPSFGALSARFADIARLNAEIGFDRLEPRTVLRDTLDGIEARLLVGPFETSRQAQTVCDNIALPARVNCIVARFSGELIARQ